MTATSQMSGRFQQYRLSDGRYDLEALLEKGFSDLGETGNAAFNRLRNRYPNARFTYETFEIEGNAKQIQSDRAFCYRTGNVLNARFLGTGYEIKPVGLSFKNPQGDGVFVGSGDENLPRTQFFPRMSFKVLMSLLAGKDLTEKGDERAEHSAIKYLSARRSQIVLVDVTTDEKRTASHTFTSTLRGGLTRYNRNAKHAMHKQGFTLVLENKVYVWHRPATFLVSFRNRFFILGQDENQYFGSELPPAANPTSIAEAFEALKPEAVKAYSGKEAVLRQGEWFAVPVATAQIPKSVGILTSGSVILPKDDPTSADHEIEGHIRIVNNQVYARNFTMQHSNGDHQDMEGKDDQWYTFYRNTAVASYSDKGMD